MLVAVIEIAVAQIPAADKAKDKSATAYWVKSDSPILKGILKVRHEFDGVFSADVTPAQLRLLKSLGIKTEPVQLYEILGKPPCNNDGICDPEENPSCPDCKEEEEPACYPDSQKPWGIVKVNGGSLEDGTGIKVAILDTGIDEDHPDLVGNIVACKDTTKNGIKDGCKDSNGHGTHVAGTVAANGDWDKDGVLESGEGIVGVAPSVSLMIVKVCKGPWCWADDIVEGIYYVADNGANIISISLGGGKSDYILSAIDYAINVRDVLVVAAAGNDGPDSDSMVYPGAYYRVMGIAAIKPDETVPDWSSRGLSNGDDTVDERELDLATPGVGIESTYNDGCYAYMSGTSMATPHVSGLAAKVWQGSASATRDYLDSNITKDLYAETNPSHDIYTGFGLPIAP
jgi:subtilisin